MRSATRQSVPPEVTHGERDCRKCRSYRHFANLFTTKRWYDSVKFSARRKSNWRIWRECPSLSASTAHRWMGAMPGIRPWAATLCQRHKYCCLHLMSVKWYFMPLSSVESINRRHSTPNLPSCAPRLLAPALVKGNVCCPSEFFHSSPRSP